jgi:hypothetical protein
MGQQIRHLTTGVQNALNRPFPDRAIAALSISKVIGRARISKHRAGGWLDRSYPDERLVRRDYRALNLIIVRQNQNNGGSEMRWSPGTLWRWLRNPKNRTVLGWLGGGLAVLASGAWVAITHFSDDKPSSKMEMQHNTR